MAENAAVDELIRTTSDPAASRESLGEAIGRAVASLRPGDRPGAEATLRRLAEEAVDAPTRPDKAGAVALVCGALAERGLDPTIALGPILDRLERQVAPDALAFVSACQQAAAEDPPPADGEQAQADPVARHGERLAALMPTEAESFAALEPFSMAAIAMLARSAPARNASRSRSTLRRLLDDLGGQYGHAGFLWMMMQVLDDEPVVVIHPGEAKGYRVRITGLADNFQFHTLGWPTPSSAGSRRDGSAAVARRTYEVAAARDGSAPPAGAPPARGSFNLWTWRGLAPDGTLRDAMSGSGHWVWNEGVPADIPTFEETRVVLLGPPPYERSWNPGRKFPDMPGDLRVERVLTLASEVRDLLRRIAAAG